MSQARFTINGKPAEYCEFTGRPVLFLDVDGVLNCHTTKERTPHGFMGVEPRFCDLLRRIVAQTGCQIVLSSTWRTSERLLPYLWERLGCEVQSRYIGDTPNMEVHNGIIYEAKPRGLEIDAWLKAHPEVQRFVILDDRDDMEHLKPHLIQTDCGEGLTQEIANRIIEWLNAP